MDWKIGGKKARMKTVRNRRVVVGVDVVERGIGMLLKRASWWDEGAGCRSCRRHMFA